MKLILFLVFLVVVYADPKLNEGEDCAKKCADTCIPCENYCRDQTIGDSQKKCKECQQNCQQCLSACHDGDQLDTHQFHPSIFIPVGRCRTCRTQCKACRLRCGSSGNQNCDDCELQCSRCDQICNPKEKRQQPVPDCQEKCSSLCTYGKQEDCDKCLSECESDGGKSSQKSNGDQEKPDLIPLGSCRKCMTYCNLCEVSCKNAKKGQPGCEKCEEKCLTCREICSTGSKTKRDLSQVNSIHSPNNPHPPTDLPIDSCVTRCSLICKGNRRNSQECKNCMQQCADDQQHVLQDTKKDGQNSPSDDECLVQCISACINGLDACDYCFKKFKERGGVEKQEDQRNSSQGQGDGQTCAQQCSHFCIKQQGQEDQCIECLNKCRSGDQGLIPSGNDLPKCRTCKLGCNFCLIYAQSQGKGNENQCDSVCSPCKSICQGEQANDSQPGGQEQGCAQQCSHFCIKQQGQEEKCLECLNKCHNGDQGQIPSGNNLPKCRACKIGCDFCLIYSQTVGLKDKQDCDRVCSPCKDICQGDQASNTQNKSDPNDKCTEMCRGVCYRDPQGESCKTCLNNCENDGSKSDGQEKDPECASKCRKICTQFGYGQQCRECFKNCNDKAKTTQTCSDCIEACRSCIAENYKKCSRLGHDQIPECKACRKTCQRCRDSCQ